MLPPPRLGPILGPGRASGGTGLCNSGTPVNTLIKGRVENGNVGPVIPADGTIYRTYWTAPLTINTGGFVLIADGVGNYGIQVPFTGYYNLSGHREDTTVTTGNPATASFYLRVNNIAMNIVTLIGPPPFAFWSAATYIYYNNAFLTAGDIIDMGLSSIGTSGMSRTAFNPPQFIEAVMIAT